MSIEPILRAIAELRDEVDRLTDPASARRVAPPPEPAAPRLAPVRPSLARDPNPEMAPAPVEGGGDPGERLDALARRLLGRLQRAERRPASGPEEAAG